MFLGPPFFLGGGLPRPVFLDVIYLIEPFSNHVAKFHGDRSRDLRENLAKEKEKKKQYGQNIRPPVKRMGGLIIFEAI